MSCSAALSASAAPLAEAISTRRTSERSATGWLLTLRCEGGREQMWQLSHSGWRHRRDIRPNVQQPAPMPAT
jgi:hypothetical protein